MRPFAPENTRVYTFADAADSYIQQGGEARYLERIIDYFGETPVALIYPFDVKEMAKALYPTHKPATLNRHAITPVRAVINHAYDRGWITNAIRLRNFKQESPKKKKPASPTWLHLFIRRCDHDQLPHVAAIVLFMAHTAARVSEAIALKWEDIDFVDRTATLVKTKTETNSVRGLTDELINRLREMKKEAMPGEPVFRYISRFSVNERIKAVCARADIPYKSSHACGRHTFATRMMDLGIDVKTAMTAGGWKTVQLFLGTYVESRKNAARIVADRLNIDTFDADV